MSQNGNSTTATTTSPCQPWCTINHNDPIFDLDCHISEIDWTYTVGFSLGTSDGSPIAVEASWDHGGPETVNWTPAEARQAAALLLKLADVAEWSAKTDAERAELTRMNEMIAGARQRAREERDTPQRLKDDVAHYEQQLAAARKKLADAAGGAA